MELTYIMPDWDDYLDADFDFINDKFSTENRKDRNEVYLYELMGDKAPFDGVLVSLAQIVKKKGALRSYNLNGNKAKMIRELMRIPPGLKIFGDCGAFSYKDEEKPSFTPEEAARLYHELGFDVGASVDHMVIAEKVISNEKGKEIKVPLTKKEQQERVEITITNADIFMNEVKKNNYYFIPMGTIQALTPKDYADKFMQYVEMGYEYIALGSLVPKSDKEILKVILAVGEKYNGLSKSKRDRIKIHLFGVLRPKLYKYYKHNGISSFDSASYFRKAWLRSKKNYLGVNGEWYAALRVPQTTLSQNKKKLAKKNIDIRQAEELEKKVLKILNEYDMGKADLDKTLELLVEYDKLFERSSEDAEKIRKAYRRTLQDMPWKQCSCPICKSIGIHVVIFRGYNRNKRRGFHNTIVFYDDLKN